MSLAAYPRIRDWITTDGGCLVIHTGKVDIGQRITTALVQIAYEELALSMDKVTVAPVRTGQAPDEGITSGSNSIEQSGHALRCAAATLRHLGLAQGVAQAGGAPQDWQVVDGSLHLPGTNHRIDLLEVLAQLDPETPVDPDATPHPRDKGDMPCPEMSGMQQMVRGTYIFVQDLDLPDMIHARIIRPPHRHARFCRIDPKVVERMQTLGLSVIRDGSFLALTGPQEWPVVKHLPQVAAACTWDMGDGLPEADVFAALKPANAQRFAVVDATPIVGPIPDPLQAPSHSARYERPYQMHGALAPSAALALWDGTTLSISSHSQGVYALRSSIADSLGLDEAQVVITHVPGSGCYGHNGADDAAFEAALIARTLHNQPILLKWTREDEHAWEPYATAMAVEVAAKLTDGGVTEVSVEAIGDTHRGRPRPGPNRSGPSRLLANHLRASPIGPNPATPNMGRHAGLHRNLDPIYNFGEKRLIKNLVTGLPHRTSAMRCLGAVANVFAIESFTDELAIEQGADPFAFRRAHLADDRALAVLDELARQVACRPALDDGQGRGIAYAQYKNEMTRVGISVELEVTEAADVRLRHALIVADAGRVIDANGLNAQLEGGFIQAASWALYEQVTWDRDGITSRDWDSYPVIRFDNIPDITVTLLDHPQAKSVGAGEASPGPTVAAIANAICNATGLRMRRMPFTPDALRQCALKG